MTNPTAVPTPAADPTAVPMPTAGTRRSGSVPAAPSDPVSNSDVPRLTLWQRLSLTVLHALAAWGVKGLALNGFYRFGCFFGTLEWLINRKRRRRFARLLDRILDNRPDSRTRRRETQKYFMRVRCDKLFYLAFDTIPRDKCLSLLSIGRRELLDNAVARGHGVYIAFSHHGAHHVIAMLMALSGYRVALVRDRSEGALRRFVQERFDRCYPEFARMRVLFSGSYPRDIYRCLRDGYLLGSAMDVSRARDQRQKTETISIFGEQRTFLSGPLRIAIRCGAPVLQAFIVPQENFRYKLEIVEMLIDPETVSDVEEAVATAMKTYAINVERYMRMSPSLASRI